MADATGFRHERAITFVLGGVAGYVDTASFFALFGLFTAHVTGNLVTAGSALAQRTQDGLAAKLAMLPIFMIAVGLATAIIQAKRRRGKDPLVVLFAVMTAMLAVFWAFGVALQAHIDGPDAPAVIVVGGAGVIALGFQNALMRAALGTLSPTTMMTGNLTQLSIDLVHLVAASTTDPVARARERQASLGNLAKFGWPLLGFVLGAAAGAWVTGAVGLWSLSAPTVVSLGLTIVAARRRHESG